MTVTTVRAKGAELSADNVLTFNGGSVRVADHLAVVLRALMKACPDGRSVETMGCELPKVSSLSYLSKLRSILNPYGCGVVFEDGLYYFVDRPVNPRRAKPVGFLAGRSVNEEGTLYDRHTYRAVSGPTEADRARAVEDLRTGAVPLADVLDRLYPATARDRARA